MKSLAYIVGGLLFAGTAQARPWCHAEFVSENGTEISMDHQVETVYSRFGTYQRAANLYFHVQSATFDGTEAVRLVYINKTDAGINVATDQFDLVWNDREERFTGYLGEWRYAYLAAAYGAKYRIEVAIVVNGRWLRDPISQSSNFQHRPENYPEFCPNPDR